MAMPGVGCGAAVGIAGWEETSPAAGGHCSREIPTARSGPQLPWGALQRLGVLVALLDLAPASQLGDTNGGLRGGVTPWATAGPVREGPFVKRWQGANTAQ